MLFASVFRYIYYFGGLLSGTIKMNSSPLFLHQILIPSLPNFQAGGGQFVANSLVIFVLVKFDVDNVE